MRFCAAAGILLLLSSPGRAQDKDKHASPAEPRVVTVPAVVDHNRVIVEADIALPNGSTQRVHAWIDSGNPRLYMSSRVVKLIGSGISCDGQECAAQPPHEITIGGMKISLAPINEAWVYPHYGREAMIARGLPAEISIPSTILRNYDVLIDFPGHKLTIGEPGTIHFLGMSSKVQITPENGLIQVPAQIENKKYNLALDLGSCISFLSQELFDKLAAAHADWQHMTGAVGSANMWGLDDETKWRVTRVDRMQYGPLFLTDVAVVALPATFIDFLEKPTGISNVGLLGSQALQNYRVGIDYAHSTVYFDIGRLYNFPDFDVIGVILRPEDDGRFKILGVADFDGKPSVPQGPEGVQPGDHLIAVDDIPVQGVTMGQVWSMLGGTPGQTRKLTIEHDGKQFVVAAIVRHFLAEPPDDSDTKKKK